MRATELGVKCLLVADEGVLWTLHRARAAGILPADTTLKVSALVGPVNPASFAVHEQLGADSINVPSDLTLAHLTEIRRVSAAPMDMYIEAPDDLGGYVRMYEVAELIRRGAPVYLKFGLAKAPGIYPYGHHLREVALSTAKERVRRGRIGAGPAGAARRRRRYGAARFASAGRPAQVRHPVITFRKLSFTQVDTAAHNPTHPLPGSGGDALSAARHGTASHTAPPTRTESPLSPTRPTIKEDHHA